MTSHHDPIHYGGIDRRKALALTVLSGLAAGMMGRATAAPQTTLAAPEAGTISLGGTDIAELSAAETQQSQ